MPRFQKGQSKGSVQVAKKGYRVRMYAHGQSLYGPWRDTHAKAEADLARVRACDDKEGLLRQLVVGAGGEGARKGGRSTAGAPRLLPVPLYPDVFPLLKAFLGGGSDQAFVGLVTSCREGNWRRPHTPVPSESDSELRAWVREDEDAWLAACSRASYLHDGHRLLCGRGGLRRAEQAEQNGLHGALKVSVSGRTEWPAESRAR